ncbi:MAG: hypothetical protein HY243_04505 [Proteobacteria bacterium]|nr:hypothetical protein [Pseudomonadota bacterium]
MRWMFVALLVLACAGCNSVRDYVAPPPPDPKIQMAALENRIFELVQDERRKIDPKAKTLQLDSELSDVARRRSADMAEKNYFDSKSPTGESSASIIMKEDLKFQGLLGENIAEQTYKKRPGFDVEIFARKFVDSWLASAPHKENLSYARYDRAGVGAAVSGDTVYVTELFATDLGLPPPPNEDTDSRDVKELPDAKSADAPPTKTSEPGLRGAIVPVPQPSPQQ